MWRTVYNAGETKWQGVKTRPLYNPEITLGEVLLKSMQVHGSKIAQVCANMEIDVEIMTKLFYHKNLPYASNDRSAMTLVFS